MCTVKSFKKSDLVMFKDEINLVMFKDEINKLRIVIPD